MKNWHQKKVLVTGGLGFIGSNLAEKLCQLGATVSILDDLSPFAGGNLKNIEEFRSQVTLSHERIEEVSVAARAVTNQDVVFHCAALSSHPGSMRDPKTNIDVNCAGTIQLLEAIKRYNPECRFIGLGTTTQLGKLIYQPADENHPEFPLDIYSANKCASEMYSLIYAHAFGVKAAVVRLPNIYGPRAAIHSPEFTFNNYFIGLALSGRAITVYGDGAQKRNSLYVADAVDAIIAVAEKKDLGGQVYLAVSDEHYSVKEIAEAIIEIFGKGRLDMVPWPAQRAALEVGDAIFTNKKILQEIGWKPKISLKEGLKLTLDFYQSRLSTYLR